MPRTVIDLSRRIEPGMPVFPGTRDPRIEVCNTIDAKGYEERLLDLSSHLGTHVDAPAHLIEGASRLDAVEPHRLIGRGLVIDISEANGGDVGLEALQSRAEHIRQAEFVLLRTGWAARWGRPDYFEGFPALTPKAAAWLAKQGVYGVGVDAASVDRMESSELPVHRALLGAGVLLIENLQRLEELPAEGFQLCVAPLLILDADGAPARVLAWLD